MIGGLIIKSGISPARTDSRFYGCRRTSKPYGRGQGRGAISDGLDDRPTDGLEVYHLQCIYHSAATQGSLRLTGSISAGSSLSMKLG